MMTTTGKYGITVNLKKLTEMGSKTKNRSGVSQVTRVRIVLGRGNNKCESQRMRVWSIWGKSKTSMARA